MRSQSRRAHSKSPRVGRKETPAGSDDAENALATGGDDGKAAKQRLMVKQSKAKAREADEDGWKAKRAAEERQRNLNKKRREAAAALDGQLSMAKSAHASRSSSEAASGPAVGIEAVLLAQPAVIQQELQGERAKRKRELDEKISSIRKAARDEDDQCRARDEALLNSLRERERETNEEIDSVYQAAGAAYSTAIAALESVEEQRCEVWRRGYEAGWLACLEDIEADRMYQLSEQEAIDYKGLVEELLLRLRQARSETRSQIRCKIGWMVADMDAESLAECPPPSVEEEMYSSQHVWEWADYSDGKELLEHRRTLRSPTFV